MGLFRAFAGIGVQRGDDPKLRQHKAILTVTAGFKAAACPVWAVAYGAAGSYRSAAIPLFYVVFTVLSLAHFARTKEFRGFRFRQALLILLLPFFMHLSLGGFAGSSSVLLWSLLGPLIPLLFQGARASVPWFAVYVAMVAIGGGIEPALAPYAPVLPPAMITTFFAMNIIVVSAITYAAIRYFAVQLEEEQAKIARIVDSSAESPDDIAKWAGSVTSQMAEVIGVEEITVWTLDGQRLSTLTGGGEQAPSLDVVRAAARAKDGIAREHDSLFPVVGLAGDVLGALVVANPRIALSEASRRIVSSFAHHLGSALELRRMREELSNAADRRRATQKEMLDRGIDVLFICPRCQRCYDHNTKRCQEDGAELEAPRALPYRIATRYRLERRVGEGGMGTVFQAHDERLKRDVAMKLLRADKFNHGPVRARFEQEARTVARVDHPGVVAVYDSGEVEEGSLFIVMEWLNGRDLGATLKRAGPGTPAEVAALLRQGAAALGAAHAAGLVHRDIKPENIFLVTAQDRLKIKIVDFGIAKEISEDTNLTATGALVGTPMYMSPEQILGRQVDARSDLYSFAAVAYLALTGRRVTLGDSFGAVLFDIVQGSPPPVSALVQDIPSEVDRAFEWAFAKTPAARPASVVEWVHSFAHLLEGCGRAGVAGWRRPATSTGRPTSSRRSRSGARRRLRNSSRADEPRATPFCTAQAPACRVRGAPDPGRGGDDL